MSASQFQNCDFVAWVAFPICTTVNDVEAALRSISPDTVLKRVDADEVETWRYSSSQFTFELQLPSSEDDAARGQQPMCMIAGNGETPLPAASAFIAKWISERADLECQPLRAE